MQRRVAAVYFVFFLVLGASAYSVISLAEEPSVDVEGDTYSQGDTVTVDGQEYNVSTLTTEEETDHGETTISYTGELTSPSEETIELSEGDNVTLGDQQYFAHFEGQGDNTQVVLAPTDSAYENYNAQQQSIDYFHERMNGLWGVVILSAIAAILVVALAYMPVRG